MKIRELELVVKDLEQKNRALKNCGASLCVSVRKQYKKPVERYNHNVRFL